MQAVRADMPLLDEYGDKKQSPTTVIPIKVGRKKIRHTMEIFSRLFYINPSILVFTSPLEEKSILIGIISIGVSKISKKYFT